MRKIAFLSIGILAFMLSCFGLSTSADPEVPAPAFTLESESPPVVEPTELVDTPVPALPLKKAILITSSKASGCAVTSDGETRCWSMFAPPAVVEALPPLAGLECRAEHCFGFTQSGELYEWYIGGNSLAKLLEGIQGVIDIAIGDKFACAITVGTVQCWGSVPGRDRTGNTDRAITEEPLFLGKAWTLADAAATYACFLGAYEDDDMCIGFFPNMGTNRYAYGFNPYFGDVKDLRFSETVYCVVRAAGQVLCRDNHDTGNDPFPKDFFSNAVDFDVSDPLSCRINPDHSVECIKDDTVTVIQDLKADAVSIKTSGLEATILLSDGSVAILDSHPKYKIIYLTGFGSN